MDSSWQVLQEQLGLHSKHPRTSLLHLQWHMTTMYGAALVVATVATVAMAGEAATVAMAAVQGMHGELHSALHVQRTKSMRSIRL